ncbi:dihydrodipicolinate synthase family protein [Pontiellaceae bacterium B12219]|nr:dihydrodipicolinate synthase family protein [Pontiellaceae bacterium B12219]
MNETLKGLIVPVLTPFSEKGQIDEEAFIRHLEFLTSQGIRRIMVNGTTAEFFSLLPEERLRLLKLAREYFSGFIVLHAGGLGLEQNKIEVRWAGEFGGGAATALSGRTFDRWNHYLFPGSGSCSGGSLYSL